MPKGTVEGQFIIRISSKSFKILLTFFVTDPIIGPMSVSISSNYTVGEVIHELTYTKGKVLAVAQQPHPEDRFLFIVAVETSETSFVTWLYNAETKGCSNGNYFTTPDVDENRFNCLSDFAERVKARCQ